MSLRLQEPAANLLLQEGNELRLHELVAVWNVQADDLLPIEEPCESLLELNRMLLLHDEDHVRPFELFSA